MAASFELLVIGDDAPSLVAAAAAAASGATTALAPAGASTHVGPSVCDIPNFVWQRLNLQEFGLELEPVSARVTLLEGGKSTTTHRTVPDSVEALRECDEDNAMLWPSLCEDMQALGEAGFSIDADGAAPDALYDLNDLRKLANLGRLAGASDELIDDYVNGGPLNAHIHAHALAPFGLDGAEAGSAAALPEFFDDDAWRVRAKSGTRSIIGALRKACEHYGVSSTTAGVRQAQADGARHNAILFDDGEKVRSRRIMFASPEAAEAAGYALSGRNAPLNAARAVMRIKLRDRIDPPHSDNRALFQIIDGVDDLKAARRNALDGRICEKLPIGFEFTDKGDIIAHTAYIPKKLQEEGEWRPWTGQDRQVLSTIMLSRLSSRIDGLHEKIRKTDLKVLDSADVVDGKFSAARNVYLQPKRHNAVAAAVRLVDEALADE